MRAVVAVVLFVSALHAGIWGVLHESEPAPDFKGILPSVSYAPFEGTAHPDVDNIPTSEKIRADLKSFFDDMPRRMAETHLVIARSGAGTVAELMAIGRPAILVPLPGALDDNQTPNADILARAGAGWRVAQRDFTPDLLAQMLQGAFADPLGLARRAALAHQLAVPHAAANLADAVEKIMEAA